MLIDCPKCGFSQPKDKYCASCGIDMETYVVKHPQQKKSAVFTNPFVHIAVLFVLVFAGTFYLIRQQQRQEISRRVEYLKGPIYGEADSAQSPRVESVPTADHDAIPAPPSADQGQPMMAISGPAGASRRAGAGMANRESAARHENDANSAAHSAKVMKADVYYTLVSQNLLQQMPIEVLTDFGNFSMGQLATPSQYIGRSDVLEKVEAKFDSENDEAIWSVGEKRGDGFIGLQSRLHIHSRDENGLRGEIEILKLLPKDASMVVSPEIHSSPFTVRPGSALVISLAIARFRPPARSLASTNKFFRMFRTTDFLENNSQFVMYVVFE